MRLCGNYSENDTVNTWTNVISFVDLQIFSVCSRFLNAISFLELKVLKHEYNDDAAVLLEI